MSERKIVCHATHDQHHHSNLGSCFFLLLREPQLGKHAELALNKILANRMHMMHVPMARLNPVQIAILMVITFTLALLVISPGNPVTSVPYNPLDGCVYVYLDMGTNVGVQIRNGNPCDMKIVIFMISFPGNFLKPKNFQDR